MINISKLQEAADELIENGAMCESGSKPVETVLIEGKKYILSVTIELHEDEKLLNSTLYPQPSPANGEGVEETGLKKYNNADIAVVFKTIEMFINQETGYDSLDQIFKQFTKGELPYQDILRAATGGDEEGWIAVEDRLPDKDCSVLVHTESGIIGDMWYSTEYKWHILKDHKRVTHWRNLPPKPNSLT